MSERHSLNDSRSYYLYFLVGAALGSALGWTMSPIESRRTGLSVGAVMGILVIRLGHRWLHKRQSPKISATPLSLGGHAFYILVTSLCLYMMSLAVEKWLRHPTDWLDAFVVLVFFAAGAVAVILFWGADASIISRWTTEGKKTIALSTCSFVFAVGSGFVAYLGNIFWGMAGVVFFGWCGLALLKKAREKAKESG